ncbi:MAG: DUF554 domain-containing protein [Tannerellaceae bacterium]|jgi:uncharacterized membrane protein YqgA involved in biofilm formation|nr:DUF554 domain-containing protein [Tannerellaceae bacterium]
MIGTLVNTAAVIAGSGIGIIFKKALPAKYEIIYFQVVGLFTLLLGIKMGLDMKQPLLVILSLVLGGFTGTHLKLNEKVETLGDSIKKRMKSGNERFTEGLTSAFLLFCIGSMTILGCIEEGLGKSSDLLLTKSLMDFFSSIMLASALGIGVMFSAIPLLLFQGGITLLIYIIGKEIPATVINELTSVGGIMLIALGLIILKIKQIEIINFLPALLFICLLVWLFCTSFQIM